MQFLFQCCNTTYRWLQYYGHRLPFRRRQVALHYINVYRWRLRFYCGWCQNGNYFRATASPSFHSATHYWNEHLRQTYRGFHHHQGIRATMHLPILQCRSDPCYLQYTKFCHRRCTFRGHICHLHRRYDHRNYQSIKSGVTDHHYIFDVYRSSWKSLFCTVFHRPQETDPRDATSRTYQHWLIYMEKGVFI